MRIASQKSQENTLRRNRRAFTLLEVLLAAAIGVLLMAALYVAMEVQLDHARAGRDAVEQSLLVRALLRRMSNDIGPGLGPTLPTSTPSAGNSGGAGATTTGANNPTSSSSSGSSTTPVLNLQGDSGRLILWVSRISADLNQAQTSPAVSSDLRRITYWLAGGGSPVGLAR